MSIIGNIGGQSGGGSLTKSILIVTAPTGSTVTLTKGSITKTATEKNGEWWFKNLENGEWTIRAELDGQSATAVYKIEQFGVYRTSIAYFKATINVTYPAGSTCTATDGTTTLTAPDTSGTWACIVPNAGEWTVTASTIGGGKTKSVVVKIESDGRTESATISYEIVLFDNGVDNTAVTGGWIAQSGYGSGGGISGNTVYHSSIGGGNATTTKNKVSLDGYTCVELSGSSASLLQGNTNLGVFGVFNDPNGFANAAASVGYEPKNGDAVVRLDVTNLNGAYYIGFGHRRVGGDGVLNTAARKIVVK